MKINRPSSAVRGLLALVVCCQLVSAASSKPNIIWIFSDDHSFQTIGAYGGRYQKLNPTPHIDRIANEGMRFDRCYVTNSICAPSRAVLLTGKHSHLNGKRTNHDTFDQDQMNFAKILQTKGYETAMIGKIHLKGKMQGFDYWDVLPGQGKYNNPDFISEKGTTAHTGYVTDVITDKSLTWLKSQHNKDKPFMLMIHHKAPHRHWAPAKRHMNKYEDITIPEPPNLFDDYQGRGSPARTQDMSIEKSMHLLGDLKVNKKGSKNLQYAKRNAYYQKHKPTGKDLVRWKYQLYLKDYLRCIWAVDEGVGRILDYLKESGLEEDTIVMYCSDQGFYMGEHGWFDKRFMYEESFRTPLLVRWPGKIKPGSVNTDMVQNIDFAETFLDLAGVDPPEDMQGESIVPLMKGKTPADWRKSIYYHYYAYPGFWHSVKRHEGVSEKRFKLIRFYGKDVIDGEEWEFYDLQKDPSEMKSEYLNPEYEGEIRRLKKEMQRLRTYYQVPDDA
ncbi:MAG: sulfatase [Verrucomicrobiae bacterium]|nr:sulfatase [Verrucomicrobiae bacterium]NNJ42355.1 sulfatase [Akkermansiaceae bacterium]